MVEFGSIRAKWWLALLLVGIVGLALAAHWYIAPIPEQVELFAGEEIEVQDDASSGASPPPGKVLVFALDGVGRDDFHEFITQTKQVELKGLVGEAIAPGQFAHACEQRDALSILPSTTMAAWTSTLTGKPVGETGVPGNEWFVREERRFVAPAPVSVSGQADTFRMLNDGLLGQYAKPPTVFERINSLPGGKKRSHASLIPLYRGADLYTMPDPHALASIIGTFFSGIVSSDTVSHEVYRHVDAESIDTVLEAIEKHGIPDLQLIYFPGVDLLTHSAKNALEQQHSYLVKILAEAIGRVIRTYEEEGALSSTYVIFISDHGHTPVIGDDKHALGVGEQDEPTAILEEVGFRVRAPELTTTQQDYSAVVAYQGAFAYIYLADRSTCPDKGSECDWSRRPRLEEDVLPVARAFDKASRSENAKGGVSNALDLIFAREPRSVDQDALPYGVFVDDRIVSVYEWERQNSRNDLLQLAPRIAEMSQGPFGHRVGDVMLLARSGKDIPKDERFYFSNPYRSWHGSPKASDSLITFLVAHRARSGAYLCRALKPLVGARASQLDFPRVVEGLLAQASIE